MQPLPPSHPYGGRPYQLVTPEQLHEANLSGRFLALMGQEADGSTSEATCTVGGFHSLREAENDLTHVFMCHAEDGTAFNGFIHRQGFTTFSRVI